MRFGNELLEKIKITRYNERNCTLTTPWGRFGFDMMFGENRLRVRALFSVINEQNKLNAKNNVIEADFSRAYALAA